MGSCFYLISKFERHGLGEEYGSASCSDFQSFAKLLTSRRHFVFFTTEDAQEALLYVINYFEVLTVK